MSTIAEVEESIKSVCDDIRYAHRRIVDSFKLGDKYAMSEWISEYNDSIEELKYYEKRLLKLSGKPKPFHCFLK